MTFKEDDMDNNCILRYKLRKTVPVTNKKNDPVCMNEINLTANKPITFGRILTEEVKAKLLSKTTPLMISRKHATISCDDNEIWSVIDHKSVNGVYINSQRVEPDQKCPITVGDIISFGCGVDTSHPAEFEYEFQSCSSPCPGSSERAIIVEDIASPSYSDMQRPSSSASTANYPSPSDAMTRPVMKRTRLDDSISIIENEDRQSASLITEQEELIKRMSSELRAREDAQTELQLRLEVTEQGLQEQQRRQHLEMERERSEAEARLRQLKDADAALKREHSSEMRRLRAERESTEVRLQREVETKLAEKRDLEEQRAALDLARDAAEQERASMAAELMEKEDVIASYRSVEANQAQLETCLRDLRADIADKQEALAAQQEATRRAEADAKQAVVADMEDEFTCIVCQELIVSATILPCAHTFCEFCIRGWLKKKKNCPVCRRKIKGKAVRSYAFDSAVEKIVEAMDDDLKQRRAATKLERVEELRKEQAAGNSSVFDRLPSPGDSPPSTDNSRHGTHRPSHRERDPPRLVIAID